MKWVKVLTLFLIITSLSAGPVRGQVPTPPSHTFPSGISPSAIPITYNTLYASANTDLYQIDATTGLATYIGPMGFSGTDIAFDGLNLYGVSFSDFYKIDPTTGTGVWIGATGYGDINALTVGLDGVFYAGTISGKLLRIDKNTGIASQIGSYGSAWGSSGDLAYSNDNKMYASVTGGQTGTDWLVAIDLVNGSATPIGDIGYSSVYGLSFYGSDLYGVTADGYVLKIDLKNNGKGTKINQINAPFWGLSTSGKQLIGSITSPLDNSFSAPASFKIAADASYPGGPGVKQVEFYVLWNGEWQSAGSDTTAPYEAYWTTPSDNLSMQAQFRIDVVGNDNYRNNYAGGIRHVNIIQSIGNPNIVENWIPNRAYLNQLSLGVDGINECNVSTIAMLMAMEGHIGRDYQSMTAKADEIWQDLKLKKLNVKTVFAELQKQEPNAFRFEQLSSSEAWLYLKTYINSGDPVILDTLPRMITKFGHFVIAVGYQETPSHHYAIVYDPYGKWIGLTCSQISNPDCNKNYYLNAKNDPLSHVGQWVYYDFNTIMDGNVYMYASHAPVCSPLPMCTQQVATNKAALTPPDAPSDEAKNIGTNSGVFTSLIYYFHLPLIISGNP